MSGRKINDHSSWVGPAGKNMVMPEGAKTKSESSAEGVGGLSTYEDTTEAIKKQQLMSKAKVNSNPQKPGYRN